MGTRVSAGFLYRQQAHTALSVAYQEEDHQNNIAATAVFTFSAKGIGTAAPDRWVFVLFAAKDNSNSPVLQSVTIGGVVATIEGTVGNLTTPNTNNALVGIAYACVPSGTTADIVFTWSQPFIQSIGAGIGIDVYTVTGPLNTTATATFAANDTTAAKVFSYTLPKGGVAFEIGASSAGAAAVSGSMTNDDAGIAYTSGLPRFACHQVNADNVNDLAGQSETYTNFTSGGQPGPVMGRAYGRT